MQNKEQHKRLREFVKGLNRKRKAQAKQIDILCNDMLGMHRGFIQTLNKLAFAADFSESMIGWLDLPKLLAEASIRINQQIGPCNLAFFLPQCESQQVYVFECSDSEDENDCRFEQFFNAELIESIIKSNKICMLEELLLMGLQVGPAMLKNLSVATVPICQDGSATGFVLVYRPPSDSITAEELEFITAVRCPLSRAIRSCSAAGHPNI